MLSAATFWSPSADVSLRGSGSPKEWEQKTFGSHSFFSVSRRESWRHGPDSVAALYRCSDSLRAFPLVSRMKRPESKIRHHHAVVQSDHIHDVQNLQNEARRVIRKSQWRLARERSRIISPAMRPIWAKSVETVVRPLRIISQRGDSL